MGLQKCLRRPRQFIIAEIEASPVVIDNEEVVEFSDIGSVQLADGHRMLSSFGPQDVIQDRIVAFQSKFGDQNGRRVIERSAGSIRRRMHFGARLDCRSACSHSATRRRKPSRATARRAPGSSSSSHRRSCR